VIEKEIEIEIEKEIEKEEFIIGKENKFIEL
jgi:hypothetical protein